MGQQGAEFADHEIDDWVVGEQAERYPYRTYSAIELARNGAAAGVQTIASRNVSRGGIAFLAGQFIYQGTACRVALVPPHGRAEVVPGRVVRCRYVIGSGSLLRIEWIKVCSKSPLNGNFPASIS